MTQKLQVTTHDVVKLLNEAIALDPQAIRTLTNNRVACNAALDDHRSIQCVSHGLKPNPAVPEGAEYGVGLLGILNGIFGLNEQGRGPIEGVYDMDPETGALTLVRFHSTSLPVPEVGGDEGQDAA